MMVRERPPVRLSIAVESPSGRRARWALDEPLPENVYSGLSMSSTMPGGYENFTCTLPRDPGRAYADLEALSTISVYGPGGDKRGEYRLERSPRKSGDQLAVTPAGVGYQAALDDAKLTGYIYVDQDQRQWNDAPLNEKLAAAAANVAMGDFSWSQDAGGMICSLPNSALGAQTIGEIWYTAPAGVRIGKVAYIGSDTSLPAGWEAPKLFISADDARAVAESYSAIFDSTLRTISPTTARRYAMWREYSLGSAQTPAAGANRTIKLVAVYADHGLPTYATSATTGDGLLCSDIEAHALARWAPTLKFTTGANGTIRPSAFVIAHLAFHDPTTVSDIVKQATRFDLRDWAVWDDRTYYSNDRGAAGRSWRARVAPAQLEETGPQVDRIWNQILVSYSDVDGSVKLVGPPGSGADVEDASLQDSDPANPANEAGINRCDLLQMQISTSSGAIEVGARFLEASKLLDSSGQARLVGWVEDDKGRLHAASKVRAGDRIAFIDAHDTSYRRIVRAEYTTSDYTCTVSLDSPPDGLQQLLERLNVVLVPLGLGA